MLFLIVCPVLILIIAGVGIATAKDKKEQANATAGELAKNAEGLLKAGAFVAGCFAGLLSHSKKRG